MLRYFLLHILDKIKKKFKLFIFINTKFKLKIMIHKEKEIIIKLK